MKHLNGKFRQLSSVLLIPCATTLQVNAQSSEVPSSRGLEEVVITAQRREQSLQDTPVAVSAFGADFVRENRISDVQDVVMLVPNFYSDSVSRTQQAIAMRGAGSLEDSPGSDQAVAIFVDDVYIGENSGLDFDFFDIERIEVLRGPQGTLFGRNVVGGAVNILTKTPSDDVESALELTYGRFDTTKAQGFISGPIREGVLQGQLAFSATNSDGYIENLVSGRELQREDVLSLRGKLRYQAGELFDATLSLGYMKDESQGIARKLTGDPVPNMPIRSSLSVARQNQDGGYDRETASSSLHFNYYFDFATLTSITSYREGNHVTNIDIDGSPSRSAEFDKQENDISQFSQEFRLIGGDEKLDWVAGLYYLDLDIARDESVYIQGYPGSFIDTITGGMAFPELLGQAINTESYAVFGQGTYSVTQDLRVTAGIRYSWEKKSGNSYCAQPGLQCNELYDVAVSEQWDAFTPKLIIDYDLSDDVMVYASAARGFKSGGFASNLPTAIEVGEPFDPEYATNYEIGVKSRWLDNRFQVNATAYHVDYTDLQVRQIDGPFTIVGNAGSSVVDGLELEVTARPAQNIDVFFNYAYTDGKYEDLVLEGEDFSGNRLILTPEDAFSLGGSYYLDLSNGAEVTFRGDVQYKGETYLNVSNDPRLTAKYDGIYNASITYKFPGDNWELSVFGKNLTDERTSVTAQDYSVFFFSEQDLAEGKRAISTAYNMPMTWGVSLRWDLD